MKVTLDMTPSTPVSTSPTGTAPTDSGVAPCANIPNPWFVVYTKPLRELATLHRIREEGGTAWLPLEPPPKRQKVERERVVRPAFPRYLFAKSYAWIIVRNAGGEEMAEILTSPTTRKPLELPAGEVERLMAQCDPRGILKPPAIRDVERKDVVRVEDGPFLGFTGVVQRTARERVWILLTLLGRPTEVPFTRDQIELLA